MQEIMLTFRAARYSRPPPPSELVDITVQLRRRQEDAGTVHIAELPDLAPPLYCRIPAGFGKLTACLDPRKHPSLIVKAAYLHSGQYSVICDGKEALYSYDALSGLWRLPEGIYRTPQELEKTKVKVSRQIREYQIRYGEES